MCNCGRNRGLLGANGASRANAVGPPSRLGARRRVVAGGSGGSGVEVAVMSVAVDALESVDTSIWGPPLWKLLHIAAEFTGTSIHVPLWRTVISAMKEGIPCDECRAHFIARERAYPLRIHSGGGHPFRSLRIGGGGGGGVGIHTSVVRWVLALHNFVNAETKSPSGVWNEEDCRRVYGGDREGRMNEAREALELIRGIAGSGLITALDSLLTVLNR
jgi:hypothetical protein